MATFTILGKRKQKSLMYNNNDDNIIDNDEICLAIKEGRCVVKKEGMEEKFVNDVRKTIVKSNSEFINTQRKLDAMNKVLSIKKYKFKSEGTNAEKVNIVIKKYALSEKIYESILRTSRLFNYIEKEYDNKNIPFTLISLKKELYKRDIIYTGDNFREAHTILLMFF